MNANIPDDDALIGRFRLAVTRLARVIRQHDGGLLPPTDVAVLSAIAWEGEPTLSSLAIAEHISRPTVTKSIKKLESEGLIERIADPTDGRVTRVRLSAAGRRNVKSYRIRVNTWLEEMLEDLPSGDRTHLDTAVELLEHFVLKGRGDLVLE